ncbi:potassium channel family protein [Bradyrhizobium sp. ARR65]|uniref:potassium channel family protein n=1 Tax=Bradyrhizobium sp. ARR65 TaxID=1040989 RepID=UPI000AECB42D|nr:potassium channel family protein [Bradyrhizobium sp. ARR65]
MLRAGNTDINFEFASLSIILTLIPVAGIFAAHYLYLLWYSFASLGALDGSPRSVFTVVQLVGTTAILFALIHYYVALFSGPEAYTGMIDLADKNSWIWFQYNRLPRLLTPPPIGMVVDCLYFSFVTMATVGYGDIHPESMAAKIATMLEILVAFILIVVILARVMSRPERGFRPTGPLTPRIRPSSIPTSRKRVHHRQRRQLSR